MKRNKDRPKLPDRYEFYNSRNQEDNIIIYYLELAYEETKNEKVALALQVALKRKQERQGEFWEIENLLRDEELAEVWANLGELGDSVRDWYLYYYDNEMSS